MTRSPLQPGPATDHYHSTLGVDEIPIEDLGGGASATVSETDPGAIGAGNLWVRLDPSETYPPSIVVRNAADDGWVDDAGAGLRTGLVAYTGDAVSAFVDVGGTDATVQSVDPDTGLIVGGFDVYSGGATIAHPVRILLSTGTAFVTMLPDGLHIGNDSGPLLMSGQVDPTAGAGIAHPATGALYLRRLGGGVLELWRSSGSGDTAWTQVT